MKPFAITGGYLTDKDKVFLQTLDTIADNLPDRKFAHPIMQTIIPITCHHLAHALAQIFPAYKAIDGRFGIRGQEHSRLESIEKDEYYGQIIADPYPVGGIRPHLIYKFAGGPRKQIYQQCSEEDRIRINEGLLMSPGFIKQVKIIKDEIIKIIDNAHIVG